MGNSNLKPSKEYFDEVHKYTLEIIDFIDKVCGENNINYTLDCGTLIGAIRHKGFIPWDDDADISLKRKDYDKLITVLKNSKLPDNIKIYLPKNEDHFFDFTVRLYNIKKKLRPSENNKNLFGGFYQYAIVDIYVYDNLPESKLKRFLYVLKLQLIFGFALSKRYKINYKKYSIIEAFVIFVLSHIGKFMNLKWLIRKYEDISKKYNNKEVKSLYCSSWRPEYPGWVFDVNDFKEFIKIDFEDKKFNVVKNYDKVLKYEYGDYMKPVESHFHDDVSELLITYNGQ